jgi:hypothetical protein
MPTSTPSTAINISTTINLRADRYYIAQRRDTCRHCRQETRLVALVLPGGHEVLEWDDDAAECAGDDAPADAGEVGTWETSTQPAFLFHVAYLPEHVRRQLCARAAYAVARNAPGVECSPGTGSSPGDDSSSGAESCWVNHCEHCGAPFDDQDLYCEPGGAFCPATDAEARAIDLEPVDEPIGVDAAGYAEQPQFFESMHGVDAMNRT